MEQVKANDVRSANQVLSVSGSKTSYTACSSFAMSHLNTALKFPELNALRSDVSSKEP